MDIKNFLSNTKFKGRRYPLNLVFKILDYALLMNTVPSSFEFGQTNSFSLSKV